jgi:hypothetical protein
VSGDVTFENEGDDCRCYYVHGFVVVVVVVVIVLIDTRIVAVV